MARKKFKKMKKLDKVAILLLVIGGLNWGLFSWFGLDLVQFLNFISWLPAVVYSAVGLAALYSIYILFK